MLILGVLLVVVAAFLIVFGVVNAAVSALLWIGIAIAVVAIVLIVLDRHRTRL
jgi:hypothetical protein